jgi:hypothetical protein
MGLGSILDLTENVLCDEIFLARYATFLAKYYVKDDDKFLCVVLHCSTYLASSIALKTVSQTT